MLASEFQEVKEIKEEFNRLASYVSLLKQRYLSIYEGSPNLLRTIDTNGIIINCNETYANSLGYSKELIGTSIFDTVADESIDLMKESFESWKKFGSVRNREVLFKRKDGTVFPVLVNASNIYDENGRLVGSNTVIHDLSEIYGNKKRHEEFEKILQKNLHDIQTQRIEKEEFVKMITNELHFSAIHIKNNANALSVKNKDASELKLLEKSHLIISTWDERRNGSITKIFDALRVTGDKLQTENTISEEVINKTPSLISEQLKGQIAKKVQGPIKDPDVIFVLTELEKEEVLVIKDLHIQNEKSLDESKIVSSGSDAGTINVQKGYSRNSDLLLMQGQVSDYTRGAKIWIELAKPDKSTQTLSFYPNSDGHFYLPLVLDENSKNGFYKVTAAYKDVAIGDLSFTMGYKSKIESAKPILKNIIQSWLKGSISDDVFVERICSVA